MGDFLTQPTRGLHTLSGVLGSLVHTIETKLPENSEEAVLELQHFLIERALQTTLKEPEFVKAAQQIVASKGNLDIDDLAQATFLSSRALRRKFTTILGIGPKLLARTTRFETICNGLWLDPDANLAQIALQAGYADQAHMQREFRQFSGRTPTQFAKEMRQTRTLFEHDHVRNLQEI